MAISKLNEVRSASCNFVTGLNDDGKEKLQTRTIANFKVSATLDDVFEVVVAVGGLYPYTMKTINMVERCELVE